MGLYVGMGASPGSVWNGQYRLMLWRFCFATLRVRFRGNDIEGFTAALRASR